MYFYILVTIEMTHDLFKLLIPHTLTLRESYDEGEDIRTFIFDPARPVKYQAGQYGLWLQHRWVWGKPFRLFTVASPPSDGYIQLSTRIRRSDFKQKLNRMKPGDKLTLFGPIGFFVLPKQSPKHIVLIAGGIGVTPMHALAKEIHNRKLPIDITFIHSGDDFYLYQQEMQTYARAAHFVRHDNFAEVLEQTVAELHSQAMYYISGPPAFVIAAERQLKDLGVTRVHRDGFLGY